MTILCLARFGASERTAYRENDKGGASKRNDTANTHVGEIDTKDVSPKGGCHGWKPS